MAKKKRRVVPEVLWRLFHKRARTLADTIIALIPEPAPPSPADCRCNGRRCLCCCRGDEAFSFLLRPKDPPDYRKLLTNCFVVVSETAPAFSFYDYHRRWSQLEDITCEWPNVTCEICMISKPLDITRTAMMHFFPILYSNKVSVGWPLEIRHHFSPFKIVRRTIEIVISEQPSSSNMLCAGYDNRRRTSAALDLLTSSAWKLLLRRVGDVLMVYLLRNTSMFLPLPRKQHHQVAGYPISDMCFTSSKHISDTATQNLSTYRLGFGKKRKRVNEVDIESVKQQAFSSLESDPSSSNTCVGCNRMAYLTRCDGHQKNAFSRTYSEKHNVAAGAKCANNKMYPLENIPDSSNQTVALPKKRVRQWRWQRHRKRRQLNLRGNFSLIPCTEGLLDEHLFPQGLQCESNPSSNCNGKVRTILWCSCCLVFQTLPKVIEDARINRRIIFYKLEDCSSLFPRNHILNSLKPNSSGVNALFRDIFGYFDSNITAQPLPCSHSTNCCRIKSVCLYHSLIKLLKLLIRNARRCQLLRLLDKHCAIPFFKQKADGGAGSMFEGDGSKGTILGKEYDGVQLEGKSLLEEVHGFDVNCGKSRPETQDYQFEPSKSFSSQKQVTAFIWAVCRSIIPPDLLGTPSNWRILRKNISRFIRLRRFESFSLKQCLHKLKMSKFPLLSNKHSSCYLGNYVSDFSEGCSAKVHDNLDASEFVKNKILECWIYWLFSSLVVPLVQANFYVTESEHGKQELFYYRKAVWRNLITKAVSSLKSQSYRQLNDASVRKILSNRSFGFSRVRLCPKKNGVRVLANLKSSSRIPIKHSSLTVQSIRLKKSSCRRRNVKYNYFKSVNSVLRDVHLVLKSIKVKRPDKLGSSVFDYNEVYKRLMPFILHLKSGCTTMPEVFIIVSDVSRAFDSVDQDKLLSVVNDVILDDEYTVQKSLKVVCTKNSLWVHQHHSPADQDGMSKPRKGTPMVPTRSLHNVLVKQECRKTKKEQIFSDLFEHIKRNVLQLDHRFYLQSVGIPQGSVVSSLLCSFFYGHLENNVVYPYLEKVCEPHAGEISDEQHYRSVSNGGTECEDTTIFCKPNYLLLRLIDDYLFISTSRDQASRFFSRLKRGFREYNCYMNKEKFGLNFEMNHTSEYQSNRVSVGEDGISFLRWSGLLINCCTLEIQADYSRYLGSHLSSTLTVSWQGKTYRNLKAKLRDYLRPKCHPIFYDSNINSPAVVRLNIYQAFVLCAMKFHCYVSVLSNTSKLNTESFIHILESSLRYMHKLIKKRMHSVDLGSDFRPLLEVQKWETEWLGLVAYIRVLERKQSRYRELLSLLRSKLKKHQKGESISPALEYAVDDAHSSLVWKIKY